MPSPPGSPSSSVSRWAVLRRTACIEPDLLEGTGCCLVIGERPPGLTELLVSPPVTNAGGAAVRDLFVVAADSSGILLLSGSPDGHPEKTSYFLCDAVSKTVRQLPDLPNSCNAGLLVGDKSSDFVVAELDVATSPLDGATLRCFSPETGGDWIHKRLSVPCLVRTPWCTDRVFSYMGKLWWVDLSQGLLACDPLSTEPHLSFVPFPNLRSTRMMVFGRRIRRDSSSQRCVDLSDGKLRYVVLTTRCRVPRIRFWTLADVENGKWTQDYELSLGDIWKDPSFVKTGLPNHVPVFALIHPTEPQMVYFFLRGQLLSFDTRLKTVIECVSNDIELDEPSCSSSFILPWKLPSSLKVAPVSLFREQFSSPFDRLADSFGEACDNAIVDMDFDLFICMALADLNKGTTEEMKKFRESERLHLCYFDDEDDDTIEYAHLNFSAQSSSRNVTVFAEVTRKVDDDHNPWKLSSCQILTKSSHGGLCGVVNGMETRKRKRYCFACEEKIQHPIGGFKGGHGPAACY